MLLKRFIFRSIALAFGVGAVFCVIRYPLGWMPAALVLAVYATILVYRAGAWLYLLPGLLPVLDLYPWTGWLFIEEFDLLILTTLAFGYWRASPQPPSTRLASPGSFALAVLAVSYAVSALLPLRELEHWSWASLGTYNTPLNSLRVLKGFLFPVLLLPLLARAADASGPRFEEALSRGMLAGLALASLVVLWERLAFPGVMNFSSDYRAIGPFFEAHVGGAALDGYLALALPFAAIYLLTARSVPAIALGAVLLLLSAYACFATFSRGLYAGIAIGIAAGVGLALARQPARGWGFRSAALLLAFCAGTLVLVQVFATGGYRTLAAALGGCAAAVYAGASPVPSHWKRTAGLALGLAVMTTVLAQYVSKGAYVAYIASLLVVGTLIVLERLGRLRRSELVLAACAWVGANAIAVGWHWGGPNAMHAAAMAMLVAAALALYNRGTSASLWSLSWRTASSVVAGGLMLAIAIPVVGNYYMKSRVKSVGQDLQMREEHWRDTLDMRGDEWSKQVFGAGLGRYPENYFWNNRRDEFPGSVVYMREAGQDFVRLSGSRTKLGYGEALHLSQRLSIDPGQSLALRLALRGHTPKTVLYVDICEKWLLYIERCTGRPAQLKSKQGEWASYSAALATGRLGESHWWGRRPVTLTIAIGGQGTVLDVAEVSLVDRSGRNLIANGNFSGGGDRWFFSSDHVHLPWHAKNLWLGVWYDQGWFGLVAFLALSGAALVSAYGRAVRGQSFALAIAISLTVFFVVGLFDSLIDSTRLAALFYLLCMVSLVERRGRSPRTDEATGLGHGIGR